MTKISSNEVAVRDSKAISKALAPYEPFYERILKTGSRVICDPAPTDTDDDYLILVPLNQRAPLETRLQLEGWILGGSLPNNNGLDVDPNHDSWRLNTEHEYIGGRIDHSRVFHSWKRYEIPGESGSNDFGVSWVTQGTGPEINLLVTCNEQYFDDFTRATFLCKGLNLTDKADRVMVFEALTRDVWPTGRKKKKSSLLYDNNRLRTLAQTVTQANELIGQMVNPPIVAENNQAVWLVNWGESTVESNFPAAEMAGQADAAVTGEAQNTW